MATNSRLQEIASELQLAPSGLGDGPCVLLQSDPCDSVQVMVLVLVVAKVCIGSSMLNPVSWPQMSQALVLAVPVAAAVTAPLNS